MLNIATDLATETSAERFDGHRHGVDVSFFLNHTEPGRAIGLHQHRYAEVLLVQAGEATVTVDDDEVVLRGGSVLVVPAGARHGFSNTGRRALQMVSIHPVARMETVGRDDPQAPAPDAPSSL